MAFTKIAAAGIGSTGTVTLENLVVTGSITASLTGTATTTTNIPNLTGAITSNNTTTSLGSFSSANLATALSDKTGSGSNVFATSPTLTTVTVSSGGINVTGVSTLGNTVIGGGTTQLVVTGNARITGILTIGTSSITLDGSNNQINVGTGVTLHHTNGVQVGGNTLHSTGLTLNSLTATGVSTFTNGPILVGSATSTGTASQRLQVTGGAYVSGNIGVGTTNPTAKLQVVGDTRVSGVVTAFDFYNDAEYPSVRPTLDLAFAQTKILDSRITFTRASTATYVNASGLIASAAVNEARFDHDPVTGESLGLLVEEARTNLSIYSEDFSNTSYWGPTSQTVVSNAATAPDGTLTADNIIPAAGTNAVRYLYYTINPYSMSASTPYTSSVFVKKNGLRYFALQAHDNFMSSGHRAGFDLDNGIVVASTVNNTASATGATASIVPYPNGWYRCIITGTTAGTGTIGGTAFSFTSSLDANASVSSISADGTSGGFIWGMQVEQGAFPTSYIPTSGSTVTRSADVASMTGTNFSSWYNPIESSAFVDVIMKNSNGGVGLPAYAFKGSSNYYYGFSRDSGNPYHNVTTSNVNSYLYGTLSSNGNYKACMTWKQNDINSYINSVQNYNTNSVTLFTPDILYLGAVTNTSNILNGTLKRFTYYPKRLSNTQLQTITL